jgi:hypothetical protein
VADILPHIKIVFATIMPAEKQKRTIRVERIGYNLDKEREEALFNIFSVLMCEGIWWRDIINSSVFFCAGFACYAASPALSGKWS